MEKFDVVVCGPVSVDIIFSEIDKLPEPSEEIYCDDFEFTCGASYNTAVALSRLGLKVAILAPVGNDFLSKFIIEKLEAEGVITTYMKSLDRPLRSLSVALNYSGDRSFVSYEDEIQNFDYGAYVNSVLGNIETEYLHISAEKRTKSIIEYANEKGIDVSLDVGWNKEWLHSPDLKKIIKLSNLFTPNLKEAQEITGESDPDRALAVLADLNPNNLIVVKLSEQGAIFKKSTTTEKVSGSKRIPVDTTGAGDVFSAGLLAGLIKGYEVRQAIQLGNFCGGCSVEGMGGTKTSPMWRDIPTELIYPNRQEDL
ncbi:carbohydrate kinase family protein [Lentibacillus salinarum]|uniref:Carbohydrate kinase family protein n=1 Tax=Lentibacillus salinarum TaxID=446820 RepID=A0ABW3ZVQ7_9BACI